MDPKIVADAAIYAKIRAYALAYYHEHAAEVSARRKIKWRETHPNPRPRGRPRKATAEIYEKGLGVGGVVETDSGNVSSSSSEAV